MHLLTDSVHVAVIYIFLASAIYSSILHFSLEASCIFYFIVFFLCILVLTFQAEWSVERLSLSSCRPWLFPAPAVLFEGQTAINGLTKVVLIAASLPHLDIHLDFHLDFHGFRRSKKQVLLVSW